MDKEAFLLRLRQALTGNLLAEEVDGHIEYYRDYINSKIRMGESEEAVLASLGDPRLIARSILEVSGSSSRESEYEQSRDYSETGYSSQRDNTKKMPGWLRAIIIIVINLFVIVLVFRLAFSLLPIIFPIFMVILVIKFLKDWL